ncbi:sulfatase [Parapedobacter sp. 2B3]|uniref:sulfatase family protein n=1 Tax=Parapedobacter sp. 2B3 TaxID=3342381 RepID=UPI0035B60245
MKPHLLAMLLVVLPGLSFCQNGQHPNILFILSDDHSAPHLSCYGDPNIHTPNIDAIAHHGVRFTQMYTGSPQCVPSRATLMTGRNAVDIRMTRFSAPLPADIVTFPELLRSAGYYTGIQGRSYHLDGSGRQSPEAAAVFDEFQLRTFHRRVDFLQTGPDEENLNVMRSFLESVPDSKPFFLWVNYSNPHRPYTAPAEFLPAPGSLVLPPDYPDTENLRKDLAAYYGEIQQLDEQVGLLLNELRDRGLMENTLIIFMGDNGAALLRGKGTLYQAGLRVPLILRWDKGIKQGTVSDALLSGEDLAPTVLTIAGVPPDKQMSGRSFKELLHGGDYAATDYIFAQRGAHADMLPTSTNAFDLSRSVMGKRYKLIYNVLPTLSYTPTDMNGQAFWRELVALNNDGALDASFRRLIFARPRPMFELFDLEKDPYELNNLYGNNELASQQQQLLAALNKWMIRYQDFVPLPIDLNNVKK